MLACKLPAPGRVKLAPMLAENGKLKGDLTVFNWGDGEFWLMGSFYLRAFHKRWFDLHMMDGVQLEDISDQMSGFTLSGPNSQKILQSLAEVELSGLKMMAAGADQGLKEIGFWAMLSMRLEKSIGVWNAEYSQGYTPAQTGLDRWIAWDKQDFIGKAAAQQAEPPSQKLVMLEIDADDADASGFEPVWHDGTKVGLTTSGGYGHRVQRSFAMAMIDVAHTRPGTKLSVHVVGKLRPATVIEMSPYDPMGQRMRA